MNPISVPFVDLRQEWQPLKEQALHAIAQVFDHGQFILGPEVHALEARLADDVGCAYAISCSSGTTALHMALMALGIGPGDEVILPASTFAAPLEAVLLLGATPVLADIDPDTYCIDAASVARLLGPQSKAIIAVSLYGQPADFEALNSLALAAGVAVIEDGAQSYGATQGGRRSGALSKIACTSFFPTKPLGGAGDGGAVFTDDPQLAGILREIRDHGQSGKYRHVRLGVNGRLDSIACALLNLRLDGLAEAIAQRQARARHYTAMLAEEAAQGRLQLPSLSAGNTSAYAQYVIGLDHRDDVVQALTAVGIQTAVHYPIPLHQQPAYRTKLRHLDLSHSEAAARRSLCLPIYPNLNARQQDDVIDHLKQALSILALA